MRTGLGKPLNALLNRRGQKIVPVDWLPLRGRLQDESRCRRLAHLGVDLVVDVGANAGQYVHRLRRYGYAGPVVSLEPMTVAADQLQAAIDVDPHRNWSLIRSAAGPEAGSVTINVSANSISSSLLPMLDLHRESSVHPSHTVGTEVVPIDRLDALVGERVAEARVPFLKLDTQGFERAVLEGAGEVLKHVVAVEMEMSLAPLYEGQLDYEDGLALMRSLGFDQVTGISPGLWNRDTGQVLQFDAIFERS